MWRRESNASKERRFRPVSAGAGPRVSGAGLSVQASGVGGTSSVVRHNAHESNTVTSSDAPVWVVRNGRLVQLQAQPGPAGLQPVPPVGGTPGTRPAPDFKAPEPGFGLPTSASPGPRVSNAKAELQQTEPQPPPGPTRRPSRVLEAAAELLRQE
eukprot:Hpha_TRINITY_DN35257_c0_g1::TRINITY_DN35257_c0_g1_i1::g.145223::m.145223